MKWAGTINNSLKVLSYEEINSSRNCGEYYTEHGIPEHPPQRLGTFPLSFSLKPPSLNCLCLRSVSLQSTSMHRFLRTTCFCSQAFIFHLSLCPLIPFQRSSLCVSFCFPENCRGLCLQANVSRHSLIEVSSSVHSWWCLAGLLLQLARSKSFSAFRGLQRRRRRRRRRRKRAHADVQPLRSGGGGWPLQTSRQTNFLC